MPNSKISSITVPNSSGTAVTYDVKDSTAIHNASIDITNKVITIEGKKVTFTLSGSSLTITFANA